MSSFLGPTLILLKIYKVTILPYILDYSCKIWASGSKKTQIFIERLQNKAMRRANLFCLHTNDWRQTTTYNVTQSAKIYLPTTGI